MLFFGLYNYVVIKVDVFNEDIGKLEIFSFFEEGEFFFIDNIEKEMIDKELDDFNMWMYLKDNFNIFNEVWCEFLVKVKDMLKLF